MAKNKLSIALELGGAVSSSVGAAFKTVDGHIAKLEAKGNKAKVLKGMIGDTQKLQAEWKKAHDAGAAGADKLLRKLDSSLDSLRKQGVEVGRLSREYQRLGREAKAADLQVKGHQQIAAGKSSLKSNLGAAAVGVGLAAIPTKISADYQAIIRDIAIKSDIVNKPQEAQLSRTVIDTARETGMSRNDVADLVNQLVGAGMDVEKALAYAPTAAKFAIGQGSSGVDTAAMIQALQQNAKITDPKVMQQALEAIAYQGQAGSFEAADMAKWFPQLLAGMEKNGVTGLDAVTSLGAMLQVQMKTAGSSDEAANNFKNWMEKIGSGDIQRNYEKVGIDYQKSLNTGLQKGMNVFEASMGLAMQYVERTDPKKAQQLKEAQAKIDKEVDPEKATAALEALEKSLRTGDVFADMQVKAALTAYAQNRGLYNTLKADSADAEKVAGILDKNLAERRETSKQRWLELGQAVDDSMRSIGDAIRPATDLLAVGLTKIAHGVINLSDKLPGLVLGISGVAAAVMTFLTARSAVRIGRGVFNLARGRRMGREQDTGGAVELPKTGNRVVDAGLGVLGKVLGAPASNDPGRTDEPQRVFVVNASSIGGLGATVGPDSAAPGKRRRGRRARRRTGGAFGSAGTPTRAPTPRVAASGGAALASEAAGALDVKTVGRTVRDLRGFTRGLSKLPGGKLIDAVPGVIDTALNAETRDEKAEGYGGVAGGLAGAWAGGTAGAATGALLGSIVPGIGTAIGGAVGGAIGAVLGGLGGESVGGYLGKKVFGGEETKPVSMVAKKPEVPAAPAVSYGPLDPNSKDPFLLPALTANRVRFPGAGLVPPQTPATGDVVRDLAKASPPPPSAPEIAKAAVPRAEPPKVEQSFAFAPSMPINVQGDVKDPAQLVREMEGPLRALWDTFSREQAARQASTQLFDPAHV